MYYNEEKNKRKNESILEEIKTAQEMGISVYINGSLYPTGKLEELSLMLERGEYMSDYIGDKDGKIIKICYDEIN